jgi:ferric-dicitrate binding protein FerR (iron transport regulator)
MDEERKHFEQLVTRYLNGQLEDQEYDQLLRLLQDQENLSWFYTLKNNWDPEKDVRSLKNWKRLARRISLSSTDHPETKKFTVRQFWIVRAAAVLIVGLLITTVVLYQKNQMFVKGLTVIETPRGEKSKVYLPDGTEVWLNASSRLSYNSFSSKSRQISLTGEAYFKVKRDEESPFIVKTSRCDIQVLGTEFNVMAYDDFGREEITLVSGKVDVRLKNGKHALAPGEAFIIKGDRTLIEKDNTGRAFAWISNKFDFQNITLTELIKRLENWYDVDIDLINTGNKEVSFTGTFKNEETIWQVLDAIQVYVPISYEKTDLREIKILVQ